MITMCVWMCSQAWETSSSNGVFLEPIIKFYIKVKSITLHTLALFRNQGSDAMIGSGTACVLSTCFQIFFGASRCWLGFLISLNARGISSAGGNSVPWGSDVFEATEMKEFPPIIKRWDYERYFGTHRVYTRAGHVHHEPVNGFIT